MTWPCSGLEAERQRDRSEVRERFSAVVSRVSRRRGSGVVVGVGPRPGEPCSLACGGRRTETEPYRVGGFVDGGPSVDRPMTYACPMSFERISIDPDRMQGLPCIRGTRVTVSAILGQLAAGRSIDAIVEDYPQLEREDVLGALEYAAAATREREIPLTAAG